MNKEALIKFVQQKESEGLVVLASHEGLSTIPLVDLIAQPSEGILYDLNRGKIVSLTFLDDPKWINDYAVACVIDALKSQTESLKKEIEELRKENEQLKQQLGANRKYWNTK